MRWWRPPVAEARTLAGFERIHIVGAGGAGMSGLAKLLTGLGHVVTGSDLKPGRFLDSLEDLGIAAWIGHRPEQAAAVDLVIASSAVPNRDAELVAAREAAVPVWTRPDALDALTVAMPAIGVTGTHGKTTSTALLVTALHAIGLDPSFLVGGEMVALNTGAHLGRRDLFVLEADEAFGTFRKLHLSGLMVTNIEADHLDYYENVTALEEAFALVARRVQGPVVGCIDDPGVRRLAERAPLIGYGAGADAAWRITGVRHGDWAVSFDLNGPGGVTPVRVPRPGNHVAANAAGALALLGELGYDVAAAAAGLEGFAGVRRRYEVRARIDGVTLVDDYAHHPTEVGATIAAARLGSFNRVWAVFQPHRYSRTAELAPSFGEPLAAADRVVVTDVYAAGEPPLPGVSGRLVAESVAAAGGSVDYVPALGDVPPHIVDNAVAGDLVLLLGAGDITTIADDVAALLGGAA
jgi:UDP-N-acetylmuramate--alanine ligase